MTTYTLNEYQEWALTLRNYDPSLEREYLLLGLCAEVGEVTGVFAKHVRDCGGSSESTYQCDACRPKLRKELGDVVWFCAVALGTNGQPMKVQNLRVQDGYLHQRMRSAANNISHWCEGDEGGDEWPYMFEFGNMLAYVTRMAQLAGMTLNEVMSANVDKLNSRKERGVLSGSGDNR